MDWKDKLNSLKTELPQADDKPLTTIVNSTKKRQVEPLRIELDKRNGKPATLISDFKGKNDELKELAKLLKLKCGAGGSSRDGEILVQGDFRIKIVDILLELGYKVKKINFK